MPKYNRKNGFSFWRKLTNSLIGSFLVLGIVFMLFFAAGLASEQSGGTGEKTNSAQLTEQVVDYKNLVNKYLADHGKEQYTGIVLALMMQESGGRGEDPMQASESYCGERECIDNPELSIKQGVAHFSYVLDKADGDVKLALQSYNFGPGFIDYVMERGGRYSQELAISYSAEMYEKLKSDIDFRCIRPESEENDACYGDIKYVDAVLEYYEAAEEVAGKDNLLVLQDGQ
ncbi:lysozyme family protein [Sediminibacillus massiliensis]|uniref:lysozyme family protein n=1 Tax=Sediminibacillus massiliensis TaxID=1926277 RepID=UPI001FE5CF60|nr:lysozyme family protein [Sediminibacillus massiliensis]